MRIDYRSDLWCQLQEQVWTPIRDLLEECWSLEKLQRHIPRRPAEPRDAYQLRVRSAYLDNYFSPAVSSYAALLGEYELCDEAPEVFLDDDTSSNVDLMGSDLRSFLASVDIEALAMGVCAVFVDYNSKLATPYLCLTSVEDLYGLEVLVEEGQHYIKALSVRYETEEVSDKDVKTITNYRVYRHRPATWQHYICKDGGDPEPQDEPQIIAGASGQPLEEIPVVWYSLVKTVCGSPPLPALLSLARLNIAHLGKASEIDTVETLINAPTAVRTWPAAVPQNPPPLMLGLNLSVDMPSGGMVSFLEPTGRGLDISHTRQGHREEQMQRLGQQFLSGGGYARTATEVVLDSAQSKRTLLGMGRRKQSAVQEIFKLWQVFSNPTYRYPDWAGTITISDASLTAPVTSEDVGAVLEAYNSGLISREVALAKLKRIGWLTEEMLEDSEVGYVEDYSATEELEQEPPENEAMD